MGNKREQEETRSQLRLCLGLLQNGIELGGLHDIALDLKLAAHEQPLRVGLAGNEGREIRIGQDQGHFGHSH